MKQNLKEAKQKMKMSMRPYQTYTYYIAIPIMIILVYVFSFIGLNLKSIGTIILAFTILAHVEVSKLNLVSKKKYIAPILMYVNELVGFIVGISMISTMSNNGASDNALALLGLLLLPVQLMAVIFFFISSSDIKKAYPTMKQDSKNARQEYLNSK